MGLADDSLLVTTFLAPVFFSARPSHDLREGFHFFFSITPHSRDPPARMQGILQAAKLSAAGASAAASKAAISSSARASAQLLRPAAPQSIEQKNKQAASLSHNARSFSLAAVAEAPAPVEQEMSTSGPE